MKLRDERTGKRKARLYYVKGIEQDLMENCSFPLALYYVANYARADAAVDAEWEIDVQVLDYECQHEQVIYEVLRDGVELVGFSCYLWNYAKSYRIAEKLKLASPGVTVVAGGPEVSDPRRVFEVTRGVDYVVYGEGEAQFRALLALLARGGDPAGVRGIAYLEDGRPRVNPPGEPVPLEELPEVFQTASPRHLRGTVILETSRGCAYGCRFCAWGDTKMRFYSAERIERDVRFVLEQPGVATLFLIDAELDIRKAHALHVLGVVERCNRRNIPVTAFLSFCHNDEEIIAAARRANVKLGVGLQSLSRETLDLAGRKFLRREKAERVLQMLEKYYSRDEVQLQFILGLPGDDYARVRENLSWCMERGYFQIGVNRLFILPGTAFYAQPSLYGLRFDPGGYHTVFSTSGFSYPEILRAEMLLSGFRLFTHYLGSLPAEFWARHGLVPIDICEAIGAELAEAGLCFLGRQENDSPEFRPRDTASRDAFRVLTTMLGRLLDPDSAVRVGDLCRYRYLQNHFSAQLRRTLADDALTSDYLRVAPRPLFDAVPVSFSFDVAGHFRDPERPLDDFELGEYHGYFVARRDTAQVVFVAELESARGWGVGDLLVEIGAASARTEADALTRRSRAGGHPAAKRLRLDLEKLLLGNEVVEV